MNRSVFAVNQVAQNLIVEEFAFAFEHELFGEGFGYVKEVGIGRNAEA